ncbi:right-handed parallel beta-helix repeat-containing protein, partial [Schleiferiaceae bacterium]|nr:right-handed parallel beta-helix repeat-containing protein [Schleiferiaceae bacterium]
MKKLYLLLVALLYSVGSLTAQVMTQTFSSIPSTWTQSNTCNSTSTNASWKLTTSNPGYGASGYTDNTGGTGSYAMWVDGSSPYPCDVSITTDSIDVSTLTSPSLEFYWFKNNTSTSYFDNNTLTVEIFDGQMYHPVWSGSTDSAGWRKVQVDFSCISTPNDIALRFTVSKFNGAASFYNDIVVDDIKVQELPSGFSNCAAPTGIAVGTVSGGSATATVSLGCNSSATTTVIYGLAGFNPSTSGTSVTVSIGAASLTSLASSSTYDAYAVTSCGTSTYSDTLGPVSFLTPCAVVATPYTENLDAASSGGTTSPSLPICWEYYQGVSNASISSTYHYIYSFISNSSSNSLRTYRSSTASYSGDTAMSLTPEIQGLDSATKMLEFYGRKGYTTYPGEVIIGVTNAAGDASSLTIVDTVYMNSDAFEKYTVYLDAAAGVASGDARVAFVTVCNGVYDYMYMDDITVKDIPPCPEPIGLSLVATTQASATISWSSSSAAFNIEVGPMGFTQGTGTSYSSTTTSYTATGLTQNTYYDAYVMANCTSTGDGTSNWVGPFTFKTECGDQAVPYTNGFEGYASGNTTTPNLPDCWAYGKTGTSTSLYAYNYNYSFYANGGTNSVRFYGYASTTSTNSADGDTLAAFSPRIAGLSGNDKQVIFNVRTSSSIAYYTTKMIIATADSNASMGSIHIVDTVNYSGVYQEFTVDLDNVPTNASRVVFMVVPEFVSGYTYAYAYAYLDDIEIRDIPNCPIAINAEGNATSDSSVTLTWVDSSAVTNYIIEWGPAGFTQGTGAPTDTVTGTSWSINTLDDATTYDFYIQSNCMSTNGSMSPWVGPITVDVPCSPTAAPWADGFETSPAYSGNSSNPNLPSCWAYDGTYGTSYSMGYGYSFYAYSGSYSLYNYMYQGGGDTNVISAPMIQDIDQGGLMVKFWARTSSTTYPGGFDVVMTDAMGNYQTARTVQNISLNGNTSHQEFQVYLDSNAVQAGDKRVGFRMYSKATSYDYVYIDSVQVEAIPACINYNQMASNISSSSADLTWNYTGTNCFNVEYGPAGFIQGTGVGALSGTLDTNVTAPYSLTGLNPNTSYEFYVQNCCNNTWEGPFMFQTECTGPLAAGTYSVGPTGDFATLDSVTSTLNVCGIAGAVTFEFQSGSFSTSTYMGEINGSSSTNTITFKGSTSANDTIIAGTDAAFVLEGAKYMNFEDLFIYTPNNSGFRLNGASDITISGNTIMSNTTSTSSAINGILASASATSAFSTTSGEHDITIENNEIIGGYYGVRFYGSSAARNGDIVISGNTMTDQYYYGIYVYYGDNIEISDNELSDFRSNFAYGIYPYQVNGCQITGNHISDLYYGIYGYYMSSTSTATTAPSEITNNMINAGYYGLNVLYSDSVGVYHNTAVGGYAGVRDYYNAANVNFRNNIFAGGTYALYNYNTSAFGDYNLYYSTGTSLGYSYVSSPYAVTYIDSLGQLQSMDSTMHMNSVEGDPIFATATDLHVYGPLANDAGDNTVGVTVDIDGDSRPMSGSTTVDIGADEYDVIVDDAALTALLNPANGICGDDSLMVSVQIANNGQNILTSLTVSVDIFGTTMTATPTGLSVPFGGKDTVELGYISNFVGGTYSVVAYTQLTGDGRPGNDTLSLNVDITDAQQVTPVYPEFICAGDDVNLSVTNPTQGKVMWASGGDTIAVVDADSTIMLSSVMMDTTITVSSINYTESVGQLSPGSGYNYTGAYGLSFTAYSGMSLDSVTLFPSGAGTSTIVIEDASGTQLYSIPVTTSATGWNPEQVYLGASLPSGSYKIWLNGTTTGGLYDNLNSSFPYWSGDSSVVITGDRNGGTSWYEYFYDWKVTVGGCAREDSTFTVSIHPDAVAAISVDTANATIS